jgi:hypothetical protein
VVVVVWSVLPIEFVLLRETSRVWRQVIENGICTLDLREKVGGKEEASVLGLTADLLTVVYLTLQTDHVLDRT